MAICKEELKQWLDTLPEHDEIGVDAEGLNLTSKLDTEAYLEIGGMPEGVAYCDKCCRELFAEDEAITVDIGDINLEGGGFMPTESEPHLAVFCKECGSKMLDNFLNRV
jgi:hypothetical protein